MFRRTSTLAGCFLFAAASLIGMGETALNLAVETWSIQVGAMVLQECDESAMSAPRAPRCGALHDRSSKDRDGIVRPLLAALRAPSIATPFFLLATARILQNSDSAHDFPNALANIALLI